MKSAFLYLKHRVGPRLTRAQLYFSRILADSLFVTVAGIVTGGFREVCLTNPPMSWDDCVHSRLVAAGYDFLLAPFYGSIRDYFVRKIHIKHRLAKEFIEAVVVTAVFIIYWGIPYVINIMFISRVDDVPGSMISFVVVAAATVWLYNLLFKGNRVFFIRILSWLKLSKPAK